MYAQNHITKDTQAELDYYFQWGAWLQPGETIVNTSITISPAGQLAVKDSPINGGDKTLVWLRDGNDDTRYTVTNKIVTNQGRIDRRSMFVDVKLR